MPPPPLLSKAALNCQSEGRFSQKKESVCVSCMASMGDSRVCIYYFVLLGPAPSSLWSSVWRWSSLLPGSVVIPRRCHADWDLTVGTSPSSPAPPHLVSPDLPLQEVYLPLKSHQPGRSSSNTRGRRDKILTGNSISQMFHSQHPLPLKNGRTEELFVSGAFSCLHLPSQKVKLGTLKTFTSLLMK